MYLLGAAPGAARDQARTLSRAITAMESRFGPYPYAGYAVAELPESSVTWAASSEQGFIMARTSMFDAPGGNLPLFAHEAAHAWWGNVVNTTGPGSRMGSEALAQYGAVLAIEALEGRAAVRDFLDFSRPGYNPLQCALGYFHIWREGEDVALSALEDGPSDHNLSDSKGMWFYHMTRDRLGDAAFFGALRRLLADFSTRPMSVPDIRAAFLAAAPADSGLAGFLDQWLSRTGAPVLDVEWWSLRRQAASRKEEPTGAAELRIRQRQPGEPYALDLEVLVTLRDSSTVLDTVRVRGREETFQLEFPRRPIDLQVDPNQRVLLWRPKYGPRPPDAAVRTRLGSSKPLQRGARRKAPALDQLELLPPPALVEQRRPAAQQHRIPDQPDLIDLVGRQQRLRRAGPGEHGDGPRRLALEPRHVLDPDGVRVGPAGGLLAVGEDVLRERVHEPGLGQELGRGTLGLGGAGPEGGEQGMGLPAEDHAVDGLQGLGRVGVHRGVEHHPVDVAVGVLDVAVEGDGDLQEELGHMVGS